MIYPFFENGFIHFRQGILELNHCSSFDLAEVFGDADAFLYGNDLVGIYYFDIGDDEMTIHLNMLTEELIELHYEFIEDIPVVEFLSHYNNFYKERLSYFEHAEDNYLVINKNFFVRISRYTQAVASLFFMTNDILKLSQ